MGSVDPQSPAWLTAFAGAGVVAGLLLLVRGMRDYRSLLRVADTSTSTISSLAAGEVRISGTIEPAEMTLVSLLQSVPCVYYRSTIGDGGDRRTPDAGYTEERSIGFRVRDASGSIRIFPRGSPVRCCRPVRGRDRSGRGRTVGARHPARKGRPGYTETDRALAVAALLEVKEPDDGPTLRPGLRDRRGRRPYRETRLEPGDVVTIVGRVLPFSDLADPASADAGPESDAALDDPEIAADLAAARATGDARRRPGRGLGQRRDPGLRDRPAGRPPSSIPPRTPCRSPAAEEAASVERTFAIAPETLVLAASDEVPLLIAYGVPGDVVQRGRTQFLVGLLGAVLAIVSAMVVAINLGGGFGA